MRAARSAGNGRDGRSAGSPFAPASEKPRAVPGAAGRIPEVGKYPDAAAPGRPAAGGEIGAAMSDRLGQEGGGGSGGPLRGGGAGQAAECAEAARGIAGAAARGMAAVRRMPGPGPGLGGMARVQGRSAPDLPAVACRGAGTDGAAITRGHGVPGGAARRVGEACGREARGIRGSSGIMRRLEGLPGGSRGPVPARRARATRRSGAGRPARAEVRAWRRKAGRFPRPAEPGGAVPGKPPRPRIPRGRAAPRRPGSGGRRPGRGRLPRPPHPSRGGPRTGSRAPPPPSRAHSAGPRAASRPSPAPAPGSPDDLPAGFAARRAGCRASGPLGAAVAGIRTLARVDLCAARQFRAARARAQKLYPGSAGSPVLPPPPAPRRRKFG